MIFMLVGLLALKLKPMAHITLCVGQRLWNSKKQGHKDQNGPKSYTETICL